MKNQNMTGQKYGRLTVLKVMTVGKRGFCECLCECGSVTIKRSDAVRLGRTKSCGCLWVETITKHNHADSKMYKAWIGMKSRCLNPKNKSYKNYGMRGIAVCKEWMESFDTFLKDMGERPLGMELDRIDNEGNYEPGNCRWVTRAQNNLNRRDNNRFTHDGKTMTLHEWSEETGLSVRQLKYRINHKWKVEDIFGRQRYSKVPFEKAVPE